MVSRPCLDCGRLTPRSRCDPCLSRRNIQRGSSTRRGYGITWQAIRNRYATSHPVCEESDCKERMVDVDHVVPKRAGGRDEWGNLRALCRPHHARKTALDATRYPSR